MFERTVAHGELGLAAVFGDDQGVRSKNRTATNTAEKIERARVFVLCLIGWIEEDDIDRLRAVC